MRIIGKHILYTIKLFLSLTVFLFPAVATHSWAVTSWLFTSEHDLPNSLINDLAEDNDGNIWIATEDGLCRYDGSNFITYNHVAGDEHSLSSNLVRCLFVDRDGHLLIGTVQGLQLYRPETDDFSLPAKAVDNSIVPGNITQISQDSKGIIRICGNVSCNVNILDDGTLDLYFSPLTYKVDMTQCMVEDRDGVFWICQQYKEIYQMAPDGTIQRMTQDGQGVISGMLCLGADGVLYLAGERPGLYRYNAEEQRFDLVSDPNDNFVACVLKALPDGRMMVGTDGNGLLVYDYKTETLSPYALDSYQLVPSTQKVHAVLEDHHHSLWLGLYQKGVLTTASQLLPFRYIGHKTELHNGIGDKCVSAIVRTSDDRVWVSTDNGGVYCIDSVGNPIRQFPHNNRKDGVPQAVLALYEDHLHRLWFGSFHRGLGIIDRSTGRCTYYNIKGQQDVVNVYAFTEDQFHRVWAAGMGEGPLIFDEQQRQMVPASEESFAMWSTSVFFDNDVNHLFFGSYNGLLEIDPADTAYKIVRHLENYVIHSVSKFHGTTLCLSTDTGFLLYNYKSGELKTYTKADGLPSNAIYAAAAVSPNEIWMSSNRGLTRLRLPQGEVSNYTIFDGLQSNEFYKDAYMKAPDGTLWFGGVEGITFFNPKDIEYVDQSFSVRIIRRTEQTIQLGIVPLLYTHRARYSYSLDGGAWVALPHGNNTIVIPELSYGRHKLYYRASVDGIEVDGEKVVDLYVDFPWYLQWWFVLICFLLVLSILIEGTIHLYHRRRDRIRLRRHEQIEAINDAKLNFFTNISHEIRTPMTLIVSPLERLISEETDEHRLHTYQLIQRNANRILGLINQLLDLRKIDKNQMELLCAETELAPYLEELVQTFSDVAEMRQQTLVFTSEASAGLKGWLDVNNFDKILVNLLSNALKYTPQQGKISVRLSQQAPSAEFPEGSFSISVADSGIGISAEDRTHIFERFYQVHSSKEKYGTGIGLHLTRTLVHLHHGTISVADNPAGKGTLFTVTLPLGCSYLTPAQRTQVNPQVKEEKKATDTSSIAAASLTNESENTRGAKHLTRRRVLLVDDDDEIRTYLSQQLSEYYYVSQCSNGREALDQIIRQTPDIVISDVMMPEMDGNELCSRIRGNVLISHVPIILLTARSRNEDHIQGLEVGADAFLPKPFNIDVLLKLVQSVIRTHERLRNTYSGQQDQTSKVEVVIEKTPDERLLDRINRVLNERISDPSLSAEMVADQVGLSRVHLYRKLKELTNQSARDYIRNMRIIKAAELLASRKMAIGEVAAKVGYTDQRNFSTAFKSIYGMTPSEYMDKHINASHTPEETKE